MNLFYVVMDAPTGKALAAFADKEEALDFDAAYGGCTTYTTDYFVYDTLDEFEATNPGYVSAASPCPYGG